MRSRGAGATRHLANEQDTTGPSQRSPQDVFLMVGETSSSPDKCICPLGKMQN